MIKKLLLLSTLLPSTLALADTGQSILRINGLSELNTVQRVEKIKVCDTNNKCFRYNINKNIAFSQRKNGYANYITSVALPSNVEMKYLVFESPSKKGVSGKINFENAIKVEEGYNYQALVKFSNTSTNLYPTEVDAQYYHKDIIPIFYNPKSDFNEDFSNGVSLNIPQGALKKPIILNIAIHDIGDESPLIDIYPYIKLDKNMEIRFSNIKKGLRSFDDDTATKSISTNATGIFDKSSFASNYVCPRAY